MIRKFKKTIKIGLAFILFIPTLILTAQEQDLTALEQDSIYLKHKWNIGETLVYRMINSDLHQNKTGFAFNIIQDTQFVFLNPVKIKDKKTLVRVKFRKTMDEENDTFEFRNFSKNFESVLIIDSLGLIDGIYNWKMFSYKYIDMNAKNYEKGYIDSTGYEFFNKFYAVKSNIEDIVLQDLNKMFMAYGYGYRVNTTYLIKRKLPNPFRGEALVVKGTSTLSKPLGSKNTYELKNKSGVDESHTTQIGNDFLNLKKSQGKPYNYVAPIFYIGNEEEFYFNSAQGRITFCKIKDSLISDLESRIVVVEFQIVKVDNP